MSYILANAPCPLYIISSAVLTQVCEWFLVNQLQTDQTCFSPVPDHHGANSVQKLIHQITDWQTDSMTALSILHWFARHEDCMILLWWIDFSLCLFDGDFLMVLNGRLYSQ